MYIGPWQEMKLAQLVAEQNQAHEKFKQKNKTLEHRYRITNQRACPRNFPSDNEDKEIQQFRKYNRTRKETKRNRHYVECLRDRSTKQLQTFPSNQRHYKHEDPVTTSHCKGFRKKNSDFNNHKKTYNMKSHADWSHTASYEELSSHTTQYNTIEGISSLRKQYSLEPEMQGKYNPTTLLSRNKDSEYNKDLVRKLISSSRHLPSNSQTTGKKNDFTSFWKWHSLSKEVDSLLPNKSDYRANGTRRRYKRKKTISQSIKTKKRDSYNSKNTKKASNHQIAQQMKKMRDIYTTKQNVDHSCILPEEINHQRKQNEQNPVYSDITNSIAKFNPQPVDDITLTDVELNQVASYFHGVSINTESKDETALAPKENIIREKRNLHKLNDKIGELNMKELASCQKRVSSAEASQCSIKDTSMSLDDLIAWAGDLDMNSFS